VVVFALGGGARVATTPPDGVGSWSVTGLVDGSSYTVRFTKVGFGVRWAKDGVNATPARPVVAPNAFVDAVLTPTASLRTISGVAILSNASPAVGCPVRLFDGPIAVASTLTDGAGGYAFPGLTPKGRYTVQICAPGALGLRPVWATTDGGGALLGTTGAANLFFDATAGNVVVPTTTVFNTTTESRTITATITNDGQGVDGVEVRVYDSLGFFVASTRTNANGVYVVGGLRPGANYKVWVWTKCASCTAGAFTSQWYGGVIGEQFDQSGKLADTIDLTTANSSFNLTLS
jgi:hypothetical protein